MFTGLIEHTARILSCNRVNKMQQFVISSPFEYIQAGDSISVNGVCLTVLANKPKHELHFDVSPETAKCTTLSDLTVGTKVNLERAMLAATRFGGHYVSGHVDMNAKIVTIQTIGDCLDLGIAGFAKEHLLYLIPKGSVTVDGVSLTINAVEKGVLKVLLVPHTLAQTTLNLLKAGQAVNIEFDYLTRIIAHQLQIMRKTNLEVDL